MEIHLLRTGGAVFVRDGKEIARYDEPRLMADAVAVLLDELEELVELRTKLRNRDATIAKLPKTADGVVIVPGMRIWPPEFSLYGIEVVGIEGGGVSAVHRVGRSKLEYITTGSWFSTKEAAEAAREQEGKV